MRKFFYDTEFMESPGHLELISIGVVDESGERQFYACNAEADFDKANDWVDENVIPKLPPVTGREWMSMDEIRENLLGFLEPSALDPVEMWGWYSAYDHVLLCWIFGRMVDLPPGMPMHTMDLRQEMISKGAGLDVLPGKPENAHDALADARWTLDAWKAVRGTVQAAELAEWPVLISEKSEPINRVEVGEHGKDEAHGYIGEVECISDNVAMADTLMEAMGYHRAYKE